MTLVMWMDGAGQVSRVCVNLAAAQRIQRVALKKNRERESSVSVERTKSNGHIGLVKQ
jgi:hypothetical protein